MEVNLQPMQKKYSFYTYDFEPGSSQGDLYDGNQPFGEQSEKHRRSLFEFLFGKSGALFNIRNGDYPCTVMAHNDGIVMLRVERPRNVPLYIKEELQQTGVIPRIDKEKRPSNPYNYVIVDFREGRNLVAISIDGDAWRDTNTVANMLRESVNAQFDALNRDMHIVLQPLMFNRDFVEYSRYLIKKKQRRVTKMTFYFTGGKINPEMEAIIKKDGYLSGLKNRSFKSRHTEISYIDPDSRAIARKNSSTLEHFVMLVMSEPDSDAFRLRITYDDGTTLNCGKQNKFEYEMPEDVFDSIFGFGSMFPEQNIGAWLDRAKEAVEEVGQ